MSFQALMEELLERTGASRTTLRLDDTPGQVFPVKAEALAPGMNSIAGETSIDIRGSMIFKHMDRERKMLVQEDLLTAELRPPQELIERYGAKAQMLMPLEREGRFFGIISVHYAPGPRKWTAEDMAALDDVAARVRQELG